MSLNAAQQFRAAEIEMQAYQACPEDAYGNTEALRMQNNVERKYAASERAFEDYMIQFELEQTGARKESPS